ncbi:MAG: EamA family transporter [Hyphomicrobiales bacterium]
MEPIIVFAVLAAAIMHASWNALIKTGLDKFLSISMMSLFMGLLALLALPFVPFPDQYTWMWIIISAVLHTGYKLFLIRAYAAGDLSQVYPLARGTAPLITAFASFALLGEHLGTFTIAGIFVLCAGVWLMCVQGGMGVKKLDKPAIAYALGTSLFIAAYTITDGIGGRGATSVTSYTMWMFALDAVIMMTVCLSVRGINAVPSMMSEWKSGLIAAALSVCAYWIVIWAMTQAPIAAVAALRETSVLAALLISVVVLKEKVNLWRIWAAITILAGVVLLRTG